MKPAEIYVGLKVVTTDADNATVYIVRIIDGHQAHLVYKRQDGVFINSGWVDISLLRFPTVMQMLNV